MEGVNGANPVNPAEQSHGTKIVNTPPAGQPIGAPAAEPDVSVAISELAQARMNQLDRPASADSTATMQYTDNGGVDFGVDRGGFEWPLNTQQKTTAAQGPSESMDVWKAANESVNGVHVDDAQASESAYIALGKSTVNANE